MHVAVAVRMHVDLAGHTFSGAFTAAASMDNDRVAWQVLCCNVSIYLLEFPVGCKGAWHAPCKASATPEQLKTANVSRRVKPCITHYPFQKSMLSYLDTVNMNVKSVFDDFFRCCLGLPLHGEQGNCSSR